MKGYTMAKKAKTQAAAAGQTMEVVMVREHVVIPPPKAEKQPKGETVDDVAWKYDASVLNDKIKADLASGESAQLSLCRGFNAMNSGIKPSLRLYRALGHTTFEWYCESLAVALSTGHMYVTIGKLLATLTYTDAELLTIGISSLREIARLVKKDNKHAALIVELCNDRLAGMSLSEITKGVNSALGTSASKPQGTKVDMTDGDETEVPTAQVEPWRSDVQIILDAATSFAEFGKHFREFAKAYKAPATEAVAA